MVPWVSTFKNGGLRLKDYVIKPLTQLKTLRTLHVSLASYCRCLSIHELLPPSSFYWRPPVANKVGCSLLELGNTPVVVLAFPPHNIFICQIVLRSGDDSIERWTSLTFGSSLPRGFCDQIANELEVDLVNDRFGRLPEARGIGTQDCDDLGDDFKNRLNGTEVPQHAFITLIHSWHTPR